MKTKKIPKATFKLADIIREKNLTQRKTAKLTGISKNGISVLAGEPKQITFETIAKLCHGLNVMPADLFVLE